MTGMDQFTRERCGACPLRDPDPCLGQTSGGVCERAAREDQERFRVSLARRARNLAGAIVAAVASGGKRVTPAEAAERLATCGGCEFYVGKTCSRCGCHMPFKVLLEAWHCPIGKF